MKKILIFFSLGSLFGALLVGGLAIQKYYELTEIAATNEAAALSLSTYTDQYALHHLLTHSSARLRESTETSLTYRVKMLENMRTVDAYSGRANYYIVRNLVAISVMNEKFRIERWKQDTEMIAIFDRIQSEYPDLTASFQCRDWASVRSYEEPCENPDTHSN